MKVSYFQYRFRETRPEGSVYRRGLQEYLRSFCNHPDVSFKNQFVRHDENLYLLPLEAQLFGFVQTRSGETISKINRADLSHSDIYESLRQNENLGFMSYVFVDNDCFAFGSTVLAPRVKAFADFMDLLLNRTRGGQGLEFVPAPILRESTKAEVMRMNFVGKAVIQVEPGNTFFHGMQNLIGGTAESYEEVDSFEIVIKPKKRKDIKPVVGNALHAISDDHVRKIVVNAKRETEERLEELYVAGKGHIADAIDGNSASIGSNIRYAIENNRHLAAKRQELNDEQEASEQVHPPFLSGAAGSSGDDMFLPLPVGQETGVD